MSPTGPPEAVYNCGNRFPELYTCKKCLFRTDLYVFYNKHVQSAHQNRKLNFDYQPRKHVCQECRLTSHSLLQWFGHRCKKWYKCAKCPFITKNVELLRSHWQTVHEVKGVFKCDKCSFVSSRPEYLEIHNQTKHQAQKWYTCLECPFGSLDQCSVRLHVRKEHKTEWKEISVLSERIDKDSSKELIRRTGAVNGYNCKHCNFKTKNKYALSTHVTLNHVKCPYCDWRSPQRYQLKEHILDKHQCYSCSNRCLELYTCKKCTFDTEFYVYYHRHVQLVHRKCKLPFKYQPKRHVCNRCKFATHSWLHWFQHQQRPCRKIGTTVTNILLEERSRVFKSQTEKTCGTQRQCFRQLHQMSIQSVT